MIEDEDAPPAGFAIVMWDAKGEAIGSYSCSDYSPISHDLLPVFAMNVLQKLLTRTQAVNQMFSELVID
jgi:hypothetical protein